jgi:hypothetical protein
MAVTGENHTFKTFQLFTELVEGVKAIVQVERHHGQRCKILLAASIAKLRNNMDFR